jgi:hypothetical protein
VWSLRAVASAEIDAGHFKIIVDAKQKEVVATWKIAIAVGSVTALIVRGDFGMGDLRLGVSADVAQC